MYGPDSDSRTDWPIAVVGVAATAARDASAIFRQARSLRLGSAGRAFREFRAQPVHGLVTPRRIEMPDFSTDEMIDDLRN